MACKSYLLLLALIVMSVLASARRPPVVVNHEPSEPISAPIREASVPISVPIHEASASARRPPVVVNHEAFEPISPPFLEAPEPISAPIHEAFEPISASIHEAYEPISSIHEASEPISDPSIYGGTNELGNSKVRIDGDEKQDGAATGRRKTDGVETLDSSVKGLQNEKTDDDGNGKLKPDSTHPGPLAGIGLIPVIPGLDGSFHFGIGPIDFGGNIGWGGFAPGYVVPYRQHQPYVAVSPYTSPYATPVTGYGQPLQGYYGPVPGYGQPPQGPYSSGRGNAPPVQYGQPSLGYYGPYASTLGNAPSSSQFGGPFFNRYN